jgi:integrase
LGLVATVRSRPRRLPQAHTRTGPAGLIAILWRAGLRISEALALGECDLDAETVSVLVRAGKGGKRRIVGMDDWGSRWTEHRRRSGFAVCRIEGLLSPSWAAP